MTASKAADGCPSRSRTGNGTGGLERYGVVFCDSVVALQHLVEHGLSSKAIVKTVSPYLLLHGAGEFDIQATEASIKGQRYRAFKEGIRLFGEEVYELCRSFDEIRGFARTIARAAVAFQSTTLSAACLSDADFYEPRLHVRLQTGNGSLDHLLNGPWDDLLAENPELQTIAVHIVVPDSPDLANPHWVRRWMHQNVEYLGYRAGLLFSRWLPWLFSRDKVAYVYKENELLFETALHLARQRIRLEKVPPVSLSAIADSTFPPSAEVALREVLRRFLATHVCASAVNPCLRLGIEHILTMVKRQRTAHAAWQRALVTRQRSGSRAIMLTNYPGRPEDYGLFAVCSESRIPMIAFQHGVSRELNAKHGDIGVENSAAHLTLVYNEVARERSNETQFHHWPSLAVGYPAIGRRISRLARIAFERTEPVLFVSTNVYRGYQRMVTTTLTDEQTCELEIGLIKNVLNLTPHRVTYKPYPYVNCYADPDPAMLAARQSPNLSIISDNIDMRYMVRSARVVVTARGTSTTGWCLMSDRPVCFINIPDQMPLDERVRAAFSESLFLFDASDPDFQKNLLAFLSQPLSEIDRQWEEKRAARQRMLHRFIDAPFRSAGERAVRYIMDNCFSNEFFQTHVEHRSRRCGRVAEMMAAK